jgi:hypothetical protein
MSDPIIDAVAAIIRDQEANPERWKATKRSPEALYRPIGFCVFTILTALTPWFDMTGERVGIMLAVLLFGAWGYFDPAPIKTYWKRK